MVNSPRGLEPGQIHLWLCPDATDPLCDTLLASLPAAERARAGSFHFPSARRRFAGARLLLRHVLACYFDCAPADLHFTAGPWGKPLLATPTPCPFAFNLSRSNDVVLLAVGGGPELGVDIEFHHPNREVNSVANRYFSAPEQAHLAKRPDPARAFYDLWTRKEAYLKALGRGLSHPLREFSVAPADPDHDPAAPTTVHDWSSDPPSLPCFVCNLPLPIPSYSAALASMEQHREPVLHPLPLADLRPPGSP